MLYSLSINYRFRILFIFFFALIFNELLSEGSSYSLEESLPYRRQILMCDSEYFQLHQKIYVKILLALLFIFF